MNKSSKKSFNTREKLFDFCKKFCKKFFVVKSLIYVCIALAAFLLLDPFEITDFTQKNDEESGVQGNLPETGELREIHKVSETIPEPTLEVTKVPLEQKDPVFSLSIDATVNLPNENSLVRAILTDVDGNEYLIYESYLLLEGSSDFDVQQACEETCLLDGITVSEISIESEKSASLDISNVNYNLESTAEATEEQKQQLKEEVLNSKVEQLNAGIERENLDWSAGVTSFARLSYSEKKHIYGDRVPNFQGLEFYRGGVFETLADTTFENLPPLSSSLIGNALLQTQLAFMGRFAPSSSEDLFMGEVKGAVTSSQYINSWDWRNRHGANNSASYYFDGNPDSQESGNGWMTEVKNQASCGSCWAFAATGATESLVNLYYNRHVDLDLSEQDAVSCSGAGSCSGGWPYKTLDYYTSTGVVDEACFPYTATNNTCTNKCSNPTELIRISGRVPFTDKTEDNLKRLIVEYGPISGGVYSMSHAMVLVGWQTDTDESPIWIFKNSWGKNWGDGGYMYLKTPITNIGWTHALVNPIVEDSSRTIRCSDADGDGYYYWGMSVNKPATCPAEAPNIKDCNDWDASVMTYDESFECVALPPDIYFNYSDYSFDRIPVGEFSGSVEVLIGNNGAGNLNVTNISLLNEEHFSLNLNPIGSVNPCGQVDPTIVPGASCSIEVVFTPQAEGSFITTILVDSGDEMSPSSRLSFHGTGANDLETVCNYFNADWVRNPNRCFGLTNQKCLDYGGSINTCDSYCPPGGYCTQGCIESCME
jgi:hypothetical protein